MRQSNLNPPSHRRNELLSHVTQFLSDKSESVIAHKQIRINHLFI